MTEPAGPAAGTRSRAASEASTSSTQSEADHRPHPHTTYICPPCGPRGEWDSLANLRGHVNRVHKGLLFTAIQLQIWGLTQCQKCSKLTVPNNNGELRKHRCEPTICSRYIASILHPDGTPWSASDSSPAQGTPRAATASASIAPSSSTTPLSRPPPDLRVSSSRTPTPATPGTGSPTPRPLHVRPVQHRRPSTATSMAPPGRPLPRGPATGSSTTSPRTPTARAPALAGPRRPPPSPSPPPRRRASEVATLPVFGPSPRGLPGREQSGSLPNTPTKRPQTTPLHRTQSLGSPARPPSPSPSRAPRPSPAPARPRGQPGRPKKAPRPVAPPGGCGADLPIENLVLYPTCRRISAARVRESFRTNISRLAAAFNAFPSEDNCRALLLAPKLAVQAVAHRGTAAVTASLAVYPNLPTPSPPPPPSGSSNPVLRASRFLAQGRPGAAGRALTDQSPLADPGPETDAELDRLHPQVDSDPFAGVPAAAFNRPALDVKDDDLTAIVRSFNRATAAGPDGWNVPLLELVIDDPEFRTALRTLLALILAGTAPCRDLLCASTLIPLKKDDKGGVRPIAIGSLFYRMATKAALRAKSLSPALLDWQFGVGIPGGVEPLLFWLENALDKIDPDPDNPVYITCLDFKNTFNSLSRPAIVEAVRKHAPHLLPLLKWSYGTPSPLISKSGSGEPVLRWSCEGVRQGCPLGPGVFSIAIRDFLQDLLNHLSQDAPGTSMGAFLDDASVLGSDPDVVNKIDLFLHSRGSPLTLNIRKCKTASIADVRSDGLEVLGTMLGPSHARREFLKRKIEATKLKLDHLLSLSCQEAFLVLRSSFQLDLGHLLRTLKPDDLDDLWKEHDDNLFAIFRRIRGSSEEPFFLQVEDNIDRTIFSLPLNMGGLGILDHHERTQLARAAARDAAHFVLTRFVPSIEPPSDHRSQRDRHQAALHDRARAFLRQLSPLLQARVLESQSLFGRTWLTTYPSQDTFALSDAVFSAGLYHRALAHVSLAVCPLCYKRKDLGDLTFGHEDNCGPLQAARSHRHEHVKDAVSTLFNSISGVTALLEPSILHRDSLFNDVRATSAPGHPFGKLDVDVTIASLHQVRNVPTINRTRGEQHLPDPLRDDPDPDSDHESVADTDMAPDDPTAEAEAEDDADGPPAATVDLLMAVRRKAQRALGKADKIKNDKQAPQGHASPRFVAFVLSAGGLLHNNAAAAMKRWKTFTTSVSFGHFIRSVSVALLLSRVPRPEDTATRYQPVTQTDLSTALAT